MVVFRVITFSILKFYEDKVVCGLLEWEILKSGQMRVVERGTLKITIVDVVHNTRH